MIRRIYLTLLLLLSVAVFAPSVSAQPAAAAACVACHGEGGVAANSKWANLAGQNKGYLALQLKAFRSGERMNAVMNGVAAHLKDEEIEELASYFSSQPLHTAANGRENLVADGQNKAAVCHGCHGMEGHPVANEWPILAGQNAGYLAVQLRAFKKGDRYNPLMAPIVANLEKADMLALASYYSQLKKKD